MIIVVVGIDQGADRLTGHDGYFLEVGTSPALGGGRVNTDDALAADQKSRIVEVPAAIRLDVSEDVFADFHSSRRTCAGTEGFGVVHARLQSGGRRSLRAAPTTWQNGCPGPGASVPARLDRCMVEGVWLRGQDRRRVTDRRDGCGAARG
jgi:hypothetical protein